MMSLVWRPTAVWWLLYADLEPPRHPVPVRCSNERRRWPWLGRHTIYRRPRQGQS